MPFTVCPFCGLASDSPHDSQEACLNALRAEISRTQTLLTRSAPVSGTRRPAPAEPIREPETENR